MCGFKLTKRMNFKFERPFGFEFHGLYHISPTVGAFFELNSELERLDGSKIHRDDNRVFRENPIG